MIIGIWGSPGSGKTLTSTRLGLLLSGMKKNVLIIYSESMAVDIAWVYPKESCFVSMGDVWQKDMDIEDMYRYCMTVPHYDSLAYMSFKPKENIFSYPTFTKFNVVKVLSELQDIFDYVIVDCVSDISSNIISTVALEMSDVVYRLAGTAVKDIFFFDSNLPLIADSRFNEKQHITVLSNTKYYEPVAAYRMKYSNIRYELKFDEKLYHSIMEGGASCKCKSGFDNVLVKMIENDILKSNIKKKG